MLTFVTWLVIGFAALWCVAAYVTLRLVILAQRLDREYRNGK